MPGGVPLTRFPLLELEYAPEELEEWTKGHLKERWHVEYPQLFQSDETRLLTARYAKSRRFNEVFAAVQLFKQFGLLSVIGKYWYAPPHYHVLPRKQEVFDRVVPERHRRFLRRDVQHRPDLLIYASNYTRLGFVEVKGRECLREEQARDFERIQQQMGVPVTVVRVSAAEEGSQARPDNEWRAKLIGRPL